MSTHLPAFLSALRSAAERAKVFGEITLSPRMLSCAAPASAAPAEYRIELESDGLWLSLKTPDRYLSQSIEQDLVHTGDKIHDLICDELIDVGHPDPRPYPVEHFRDTAKLFTFRTRLNIDLGVPPSDHTVDATFKHLLAFEAAFSHLGDMTSDGDD
ncbi:MAG: hypothetical protein ACK55O_02340 [Phycisphaerales bacterium]|nr:hypothetical protein [Phycisphaeraceae bacterium]